jgi:hypothetical protein
LDSSYDLNVLRETAGKPLKSLLLCLDNTGWLFYDGRGLF